MTPKGTEPGLQVVLLAGGSGTRFWPLSRTDHPKQFLPLGGHAPLMVETWKRVRRLVPAKNIWVVAPERLAAKVRKTLPSLGRSRLILEPSPRDTAPAIALGCATLWRRNPDSVVAVFPINTTPAALRRLTEWASGPWKSSDGKSLPQRVTKPSQ